VLRVVTKAEVMLSPCIEIVDGDAALMLAARHASAFSYGTADVSFVSIAVNNPKQASAHCLSQGKRVSCRLLKTPNLYIK
jgi:hypothetical protein